MPKLEYLARDMSPLKHYGRYGMVRTGLGFARGAIRQWLHAEERRTRTCHFAPTWARACRWTRTRSGAAAKVGVGAQEQATRVTILAALVIVSSAPRESDG